MQNSYLEQKDMHFLDLKKNLENREYKKLKSNLAKYNPVDIKDFIEELNPVDAVLTFRLLTKDDAIEVFSYLENEEQMQLLQAFTDTELDNIINELNIDDMVDMIEEMPASIVKKILARTDPSKRKVINDFLQYPEYSAGSLMTIEYIELKKHLTVEQALNKIKLTGLNKETVYTCYVTNESKKLIGFVSLRDIVLSEPDVLIGNLIHEKVIYVNTHDDQEHVAEVFRKYGFMVLPVVDNEGRMTGIITVDDILDVIEQETTEDFQKMAAMAPDEEDYMDSSVWYLSKRRINWLLILMISSAFTSGIIGHYNYLLVYYSALYNFSPMIMGAGGNSGNQSSTTVIRGLATGEIEIQDWYKVMFKELRIAIIVGIILAIVNFAKNIIYDKLDVIYALIISISLIATICFAKMVGGTLPIIAKKLKIDPAIMAGPMISTLVDSVSLLIYFNVIKVFLPV
ncbi:magnesium transporter [Miniphocaeibacter massiliensis]|uniref:magnesium transporter n=1 Tax=Miniphocaeibacter massiliensis TaxID=2041841 RepID=UPI000C1C1788|nr:magnesium transporter [Miniphocaeibacter massiliensis]